ncbi:MAG: DAK2 domain-containing protein [Eubacterium sp.]|nr:DAK2 domain-containing protein [Eubacterium sp.]
MSLTSVNAELIRDAFIAGAHNLSNHKEYINELNVFPVPDGDTGTNMTLTIMSAASEIEAITTPSVDLLSKAISGGSLRGARGNSGVILSQLFRGFCRDIKGKDTLDVNDITAAFARAVETAYKAVMKPKEGTILTVAKGIYDKAAELCDYEDDVISFMEQIIEHGDKVLASTPELLPVLKEAGVVDSGGQGLMEILRGVLSGLKGEKIELLSGAPAQPARGAGLLEEIPSRPAGSGSDNISTADIKFGYCTEFIILLDKELTDEQVDEFKAYLTSIGDSIVCVADEELVKVHVHTNHPGLAFEKALTYGGLTRMKIDNMREEHSERVSMEEEKRRAEEQEAAFQEMKARKNPEAAEIQVAPQELKKYGFISVSAGDGISKLQKGLGIDYVLSGGQTMNPSTEDILSAVEKVYAENIFVFPNNKNIILAANQAATISESKNIIVIPTTSVPQGIAAILSFSEDMSPEENTDAMKEAISAVKSGEVTYAVRDTSVDGKEIRNGDIMGISDKGIDVVGTSVEEVTTSLIEGLVDEDSGLITLYYGSDVSKEDAEKLCDALTEKFDDLEVELHEGGQPIYYYIVSVE